MIEFGNTPLPVHEPFHRSSARERVCFGAVGSGKSYAICDEAIALCLEHPGIDGLITRKTIPELRDSTEQVFAERVPAELWQAGELRRVSGHYESFTFPNGSRVRFRSIPDWREHKSMNLGFICWDEMNEFDEETYQGMMTRLRQKDPLPFARDHGAPQIPRQCSFGATNPEGHDWVWRNFHPDSPNRRKGSEAFFSTLLNNPYLPPSFIDDMLSMPKPWVKRYVLCQFDDFAGLIYDDFSHERHVVKHPNWRELAIERPMVWMGMDPGTESPTAGVWCWIDLNTRVLTAIAEYEQPGLSVDGHVAGWRRIEAGQKMNVRWRVADGNAITQRDRGTMQSLQTQYSRLGYHFQIGAGGRGAQDARIYSLGRLIANNRFKISERCPKTIEAIKNYQWKDLTPAQRARGEDPKEEPLKKNTHLVEACQFIAGREAPMNKTRVVRNRSDKEQFAHEVHDQIRKNLKRRRARRPSSTMGVYM